VSIYSNARTLLVTVKVFKKMQPSVLEKKVTSINLL